MGKGRTTWESIGGNNQEQIGGNSGVIEVFDENGKRTAAILQCCGSKFEEKHVSGYDSSIPDIRKYLSKDGKPAEVPVDAMILDHVHMDHVGGIEHYLRMGYEFPPVICSKYTANKLRSILAGAKDIDRDKWPKISVDNKLVLNEADAKNKTEVELIPVSHSVPGAVAVYYKTPSAKIFHSGDMKADQTIPFGTPTDFKRMEEISKEGVDAVLVDSTSVSKEGETREESSMIEEYADLIKQYPGKRIIMPMLGTAMQRLGTLYQAADKAGIKDVVLLGYSLVDSYTNLKKSDMDMKALGSEEMNIYDARIARNGKFVPNKNCIMPITGAFGQPEAPLAMAIEGQHQLLKLNPETDVIVMTQNTIPVNGIPEILGEIEAKAKAMKIPFVWGPHASGHGSKEDCKKVYKAITKNKPEGKDVYAIPVHGGMHQLKVGAEVAQECGLKSWVRPNSQKIEFSENGVKTLEAEKAKWIGIDDKNDNFMNPDFEYSVITEDYKVVEKVAYEKVEQDSYWRQQGNKNKKPWAGKKPANSNRKDAEAITKNRDEYRKNKKKNKGKNNNAVYMQAARGGKRR